MTRRIVRRVAEKIGLARRIRRYILRGQGPGNTKALGKLEAQRHPALTEQKKTLTTTGSRTPAAIELGATRLIFPWVLNRFHQSREFF